MNARRRAILAGALALLPAAALRAQGFAGLGETAADFNASKLLPQAASSSRVRSRVSQDSTAAWAASASGASSP